MKIYSGVSLLVLAFLVTGCDRKERVRDEAPDSQNEEVHVAPPQSLSGNYLAARFATGRDDLRAANRFYKRAIRMAEDDQDFLTERALPAAIGAGDMKTARQLSETIDLDKPLATSQLAVTLLLVDAFKQNNLEEVGKLLPKLRADGFGRLLKPLMDVWHSAGKGDYQAALLELDRFAKEYPSLRSLAALHRAFIFDLQGNEAQAEMLYAAMASENLSVRTAWIAGQFYERQGKPEKALEVYKMLAEKMESSPFAQIVISKMQHKRVPKNRFIGEAKDGVAAALYDIATVLHQEGSSRLGILYAQMAYDLAPNDPFVNLLLGDILATEDVPDDAPRFYENVNQDSDLHILAQFRLAQFYEARGNTKKAIDTLQDLAKDDMARRQAMVEIGDIYRRQENFSEAIPYYAKAIETIQKPVESDWMLFYARGMSYERDKQWSKAEADLVQALELSPEQPEVLNYLAYSWADNGKNLNKALEMLQDALASAPGDPYIADSVGWALFKTGRYEDAIPYLEASVQQLPDDPTINDHLGDVYWQVGRHLEAKFQWERALKNAGKNDDKLKKQIEDKLKNGLPKTAPAKSEE